MPIISAETIDKKMYRVTLTLGHGMVENLVVTEDGLYDAYYIKDCKSINKTGRILNIVQNKTDCNNSYILFDWSEDTSSKRERIYFYQIQVIKDVTPNDAYRLALQHGFVGTISDWFESLRGDIGQSAYDIAVSCGFDGTEDEWLESLKGSRGYSAYEIAIANGFVGTEAEWLNSLKGADGKSAYDIAVEEGFTGTPAEWLLTLKGVDGDSAYEIAVSYGFEGTVEEWLDSLKGMSAYEIAVKNGFEGTEEEWLASKGDSAALTNMIEEVAQSVVWHDEM